MSQPPSYTPTTIFSDANFNTEFNNLKITLDAILANLVLIQRDDTKLKDGIGESHIFNLSASAEGFLKYDSETWSFIPDPAIPAATAQAAAEVAQAAAEAARDLALTYKNDAETSKLAAETAQAAAELAAQTVASSESIQSGSFWYASSTGTGAAYEVSLTPAPTAIASGLFVHIKIHAENTGAATLKVNTHTPKSIKKIDGSNLKASDLPINALVTLVYDGTNFQITNLTPSDEEIDIVKSNIFLACDEFQENHAGAFLMENSWSDSFGNSNEQGADETNSSNYEHDATNKLYKGTMPGTGLVSNINYDTESNHLQQEWDKNKNGFGGTTSQATVASGTTVTITSDTAPNGKFPANSANGRISFDSGSTWFDISSRDSDTQLTLDTSAANGAFDYVIRMSEFDSGTAQLNQIGVSGNILHLNITNGGGGTSVGRPVGDQDGGQIKNGQSFTTTASDYLDSVVFNIKKVGSPTDFYFCEIYLTDGSGKPTGSVLATSDNFDVSTLSTSHTETTFIFSGSNKILLSSSTRYAALLARTGSLNGSNNIDMETRSYYPSNAPYWSSGSSVFYRQGAFYANTTYQHMIKVYYATGKNVASNYVSLCDTESSQTNTSAWLDINSASATEASGSQSVYYWITFDPTSGYGAGTEVKIFNPTDSVWRVIAKKTGATWEYNNNASTDAVFTPATATENDLLHAVSEAISAQAANRMTGANLAAITDTQWEETGGWSTSVNSISRGITLYSNSAAQNSAISQYQINYDAERGAMDLKSKAYDPDFVPSEVFLWSRSEHSDVDGPGTFSVTRNGGTEWTSVSMIQQGNPLTGNIRILRGKLDISGQTSGQDLRCRYQTTQTKDQFLHSWGLLAKV
jgi:hypothetical protein